MSMMSRMRLEMILMSAVMAGQLQKRCALSTLDLLPASRQMEVVAMHKEEVRCMSVNEYNVEEAPGDHLSVCFHGPTAAEEVRQHRLSHELSSETQEPVTHPFGRPQVSDVRLSWLECAAGGVHGRRVPAE